MPPRLRPIPSTRGRYLAGEDGHIYRDQHVTGKGAFVPRRRMAEGLYGSSKGSRWRGEYLRVNTHVGGVWAERPVHRLVAEAWLPDFHWLLEVHHVNGDVRDNRPGNLRCLTRAEHERAHGIHVMDHDVANCRYDFELNRSRPMPDPYSRERGEAQRRSRRMRLAGTKRGGGLVQAMRRAEACGRSISRYNERKGGI